MAAVRENELLKNWPIVAVTFTLVFFSFGVPTFSLPFIYEGAINEFGWSRQEATLLATSKFLIGAAAALVMGRLLDKYSANPIVVIAACMGGLGLLGMLWATNLSVYYFNGFLLGIAASGASACMKVVVARVFERQMGTALGVVFGATSAAGVVVPAGRCAVDGGGGLAQRVGHHERRRVARFDPRLASVVPTGQQVRFADRRAGGPQAEGQRLEALQDPRRKTQFLADWCQHFSGGRGGPGHDPEPGTVPACGQGDRYPHRGVGVEPVRRRGAACQNRLGVGLRQDVRARHTAHVPDARGGHCAGFPRSRGW